MGGRTPMGVAAALDGLLPILPPNIVAMPTAAMDLLF